MTAATETLTVAGKPQTLSHFLWMRFKRRVPGLVEQAYAANPGLAALGPILPIGTIVVLLPPAPPPTRPKRKSIRLYD